MKYGGCMEFQEEWDQLVSKAQSKPDDAAQGSGEAATMKLASAKANESGGGSPNLKVTQRPWTSASAVAGALQASTGSAASRLKAAHEGVTWGLEGFMTPAALEGVRASWDERLGIIKAECLRLESALKKAGSAFGEVDSRVAQSFQHPRGHGNSRSGK